MEDTVMRMDIVYYIHANFPPLQGRIAFKSSRYNFCAAMLDQTRLISSESDPCLFCDSKHTGIVGHSQCVSQEVLALSDGPISMCSGES